MNDGKELKIGKIGEDTEDALGLSLASDVNIYVSEETLNEFAYNWPSDYLGYLDKMKLIILRPDFAAKRKDEDEIVLVRQFWARGKFRNTALRIRRTGMPLRWHLYDCFVLNCKLEGEYESVMEFIRVDNRPKKRRGRPKKAV